MNFHDVEQLCKVAQQHALITIASTYEGEVRNAALLYAAALVAGSPDDAEEGRQLLLDAISRL